MTAINKTITYARAARELAQTNHFISSFAQANYFKIAQANQSGLKERKFFMMMLKAGFTAGVMSQHFANGDFEDGCEYYDKFVEVLRDCDEFLS